jgi:hypothetical protein
MGVTPSRRASLPTDPASWAWLTGQTIPPGLAQPASLSDALGLPAFGRGVELLASAVAGVELVAQRWDPAAGMG